MTIPEALAVVRGVIVGYQDVISLPDVDRALAALALIEERLEQLTGRNQFLSTEQVRAEIAEAALAEAERLRDMQGIMLSRTSLSMLAQGYLDLLRQVAELEEALREIAELRWHDCGDADLDAARVIARRALGGTHEDLPGERFE